jgi:RHS repeat-associated protein
MSWKKMKPVVRAMISPKENLPRRLAARLLMILGNAAGVLLFSLVVVRAQSATKPAELPLVRTPQNAQINRTPPAFIPTSQRQPIPQSPSDTDVQNLLLFSERLVPVEPASARSVMDGFKNLLGKKSSPSTNQDNRHVVSTLRTLQSSSSPYETAHLEAFIKAQPQSRWAAGLRHELARRQFKQGWFAQAVAGWDKLWEELKDRREPGAIEVANEVLSHLLDAYIGLGKADRLRALIGEQESRPGNPVIQAKLLRARQSVWLLKHKGSQNVMCGPIALYCILQQQQRPFTPIRLNDVTDDYIATGIPLSQLQRYANAYNLGLVTARRPARSPIPTPAVMHLAAGHYSSLLDQTNGYYLLEDRPLQFKGWVSLEALEAQASGYFLVPRDTLPNGWQPVSEQEAGGVFGRDGAHGQQPLSESCDNCSVKAGGSGGNKCCGMPTFTFHPQIASLRIDDVPLGYSPPVGPDVSLEIAYNDLDDSKPVGAPGFANVGRIWSINWVAYAEVTWRPFTINGQTTYIPDYPVKIHLPGGGTEVLRSPAPHHRSFAKATIGTDGVLCTRTLPDGTRQLFNTGGILSPSFLTQLVDPSGNTLSFSYDSNLRLVAITDAIGQVTTLEYAWPGDIRKLTKVTDPFGRFATFSYAGNSNELTSVTDVLGLTTTFAYDTNEFLISMTTPYGTTTFSNSRPRVPGASWDYSLTATDPQGNREKVHFLEPMDVPPVGPPLPSTVAVGGTNVSFIAEDARLQFRNSFYWNKQAMKEGPNDFKVARNYRWFTDANYLITPILEAVKEPLQSRVWFNYPGLVGGEPYSSYPYYAGTGGRPEKRLRMLSDGTPELVQTYYNPLGYITNVIDALGRSTIYKYSTNLIDLVEILQRTGPGTVDRLGAFTWNTNHSPLTLADAAGQTNYLTYNSRGQLRTVTNPKGETTTFNYDSNAFLVSIDGSLSGSSDTASFTYDLFGRVRSVTGPDGYTVTLDYDAIDRPTLVTYPDGTYDQFSYSRLDLSAIRDRLGRQTSYTYDSLRRLVQVQDPLGRVTRFGWCECGGLSSITDPLDRTTSWRYDVQARPITKQYPDGSMIRYTYDSATGRVKSVIDENNQSVAYDYFLDGNLRRVSYPNAPVPTLPINYGFDAVYNRMISMQDGIGTTTWSYHPVGALGALQVSSATGPSPGVAITYTYDALGRMIGQNINGAAQTYAYDALGRVTNIVNVLGAFFYSYDGATARLLDATYPNGQKSLYQYYNNVGDRRARSITHRRADTSLLSRFTYGYNAVGNVTNWVQELGVTTNTWSNVYDAADQLKTVVATQPGTSTLTYAYDYDAGGNRLFEDINGIRRTFNYNALNQLVSSADPANTVSYVWDAQNQLRSITRGPSTSEFNYEGGGRLTSIIEKTNGNIGRRITLVWSGGDIVEERDGATGTVLKRFLGDGVHVPNAGSGLPVGNYYLLRDHLNSVRQFTDAGAAVRASYNYQPFGERARTSGDLESDLGFTGHYYHQPSALSLTWYRAYDARAGRWLNRDPLGELDGVNLYAYVQNNPLNRIDLFGLQGCPVHNTTAPLKMMGKQMGKDVKNLQDAADFTQKAAKVAPDVVEQVVQGDSVKAVEALKEGVGKEALKAAQKKIGAYNEQVEINKNVVQPAAEKEIPWYEKIFRSKGDQINCSLEGKCPQQSPSPDSNPPQNSPPSPRKQLKQFDSNQPQFNPGPPPPPFKPGGPPPGQDY